MRETLLSFYRFLYSHPALISVVALCRRKMDMGVVGSHGGFTCPLVSSFDSLRRMTALSNGLLKFWRRMRINPAGFLFGGVIFKGGRSRLCPPKEVQGGTKGECAACQRL